MPVRSAAPTLSWLMIASLLVAGCHTPAPKPSSASRERPVQASENTKTLIRAYLKSQAPDGKGSVLLKTGPVHLIFVEEKLSALVCAELGDPAAHVIHIMQSTRPLQIRRFVLFTIRDGKVIRTGSISHQAAAKCGLQ